MVPEYYDFYNPNRNQKDKQQEKNIVQPSAVKPDPTVISVGQTNNNQQSKAQTNYSTADVYRKISELYKGGKSEEAHSLFESFNTLSKDKTSPYYSPYQAGHTNSFVVDGITTAFADMGYNVDLKGGLNDDVLNELKQYADYSYLGTNGTPKAPTTKTTPQQNLAYYLYQASVDEKTTKDAENDLATMRADINYYIQRGYSDAEIMKRINIEDYKTLNDAWAKAQSAGGVPTTFNRAVNFYGKDDTVAGMIYSLRNGGNDNGIGDVMLYYTNGTGYKPDPKSEAARDYTSMDYHPYSFGASDTKDMKAICQKYGVSAFDRKWMDEHHSEIIANGDYAKVDEAVTNYEEATAALDELWKRIDQQLAKGGNPEEVYNTIMSKVMNAKKSDDIWGKFYILQEMENARKGGTAFPLSNTVDFALPYFKQQVLERGSALAQQKQEADAKALKEATGGTFAYDMGEGKTTETDLGANALALIYATDKGMTSLGENGMIQIDGETPAADVLAYAQEKGLTIQEGETQDDYIRRLGEHLDALETTKAEEKALKEEEEAKNVKPTEGFTVSGFNQSLTEMDDKDATDARASLLYGMKQYEAGKTVTDPNAKAIIENPDYNWIFAGESFFAHADAHLNVPGGQAYHAGTNNHVGAAAAEQMTQAENWARDGIITRDQLNEFRLNVLALEEECKANGQMLSAVLNDADPNNPLFAKASEVFTGMQELGQQQTAEYEKQKHEQSVETSKQIEKALSVDDTELTEVDQYYRDLITRTDIHNTNDKGYNDACDLARELAFENIDYSIIPVDNYGGNGGSYKEISSAVYVGAQTQFDTLMKIAKASGLTFDEVLQQRGYEDANQFVQDTVKNVYDGYVECYNQTREVADALGNYIRESGKPVKDYDGNFDSALDDMIANGTITEDDKATLTALYKSGKVSKASLNAYLKSYVKRDGDVRDSDAEVLADAFADVTNDNVTEAREAYAKGESSSDMAFLESREEGGWKKGVWTVVTRGSWKGVMINGSSWLDVLDAWSKEDASERETRARVMYDTPEAYRAVVEEQISNISNDTLRNNLQAYIDSYEGNIYEADFQTGLNATLIDAKANLNDKISAFDQKSASLLTESEYKYYNGVATTMNSVLLSAETVALDTALRAAGLPTGAAMFLSSLATTGSVEAAPVTLELMENGVEGDTARLMGLGAGTFNSLIETGVGTYLQSFGYSSPFGSFLDNAIDFNSDGIAKMTGGAIQKAFGNKAAGQAMGKATYKLTHAMINYLEQTAKNALGESAEEFGQTGISQFFTSLGYHVQDIDTGERFIDLDEMNRAFADSLGNDWMMTLGSSIGGAPFRAISQRVDNRINGVQNPPVFRSGRKIQQEANAVMAEAAQAGGYAGRFAQQDYANEVQAATDVANTQTTAIDEQEIDYAQAWQDYCDNAHQDALTVENSLEAVYQLRNTDLWKNAQQAQVDADNAAAQLEKATNDQKTANALVTDALAEMEAIDGTDSKATELAARNLNDASVTASKAAKAFEAATIANEAAQKALAEITQLVDTQREQAIAQARELAKQTVNAIKAERIAKAQAERETYMAAVRENTHKSLQAIADNYTNATGNAWYGKSAMLRAEAMSEAYFNNIAEGDVKAKTAVLDMLKKAFPGYKVVIGKGNMSVDRDNHVINISADADVTAEDLFGGAIAHELTHIAKTNGSGFKKLAQAVADAFYQGELAGEQFNKDIQTVKDAQKNDQNIQKELTDEQAVEELVAERIGSLFGRSSVFGNSGAMGDVSAVVRQLTQKGNLSLGRDIYTWLKKQEKTILKTNRVEGLFRSRTTNAQRMYAEVVNQLREALKKADVPLIEGTDKASELTESKPTATPSTAEELSPTEAKVTSSRFSDELGVFKYAKELKKAQNDVIDAVKTAINGKEYAGEIRPSEWKKALNDRKGTGGWLQYSGLEAVLQNIDEVINATDATSKEIADAISRRLDEFSEAMSKNAADMHKASDTDKKFDYVDETSSINAIIDDILEHQKESDKQKEQASTVATTDEYIEALKKGESPKMENVMYVPLVMNENEEWSRPEDVEVNDETDKVLTAVEEAGLQAEYVAANNPDDAIVTDEADEYSDIVNELYNDLNASAIAFGDSEDYSRRDISNAVDAVTEKGYNPTRENVLAKLHRPDSFAEQRELPRHEAHTIASDIYKELNKDAPGFSSFYSPNFVPLYAFESVERAVNTLFKKKTDITADNVKNYIDNSDSRAVSTAPVQFDANGKVETPRLTPTMQKRSQEIYNSLTDTDFTLDDCNKAVAALRSRHKVVNADSVTAYLMNNNTVKNTAEDFEKNLDVNPELAKDMEEGGYQRPDNGSKMFAPRQINEWEQAVYAMWKKATDEGDFTDDQKLEASSALRVVKDFITSTLTDERLKNFFQSGNIETGKAGSPKSPLRKNVEYKYTFDLDALCPRTFEYGKYRDEIQNRIGRVLSEKETNTLIEVLRAYGMMIPCVYCYVETKRKAMSEAYLGYVNNLNNFADETLLDDASRMKDLPESVLDKNGWFKKGNKTIKDENGKDVKVEVDSPWEKTYKSILAMTPEERKLYTMSAVQIQQTVDKVKSFVNYYLDWKYPVSKYSKDTSVAFATGIEGDSNRETKSVTFENDFVLPKKASVNSIVKDIMTQLGIGSSYVGGKAAKESEESYTETTGKKSPSSIQRELTEMVGQWLYDKKAKIPHNLNPYQAFEIKADDSADAVKEAQGKFFEGVNLNALSVYRQAMNYAKSSSQAHGVDQYIPYDDGVLDISPEDKLNINARGGIRKHSSNDFRLDNLVDYIQFYTHLAMDKRGGVGWMGHTYTKDLVFAKGFYKTRDRINVSVAFNGEGDHITVNTEEGADLAAAINLKREADRDGYHNIGIMAMVTNADQLTYALNNPDIDMIIPFHASGMPAYMYKDILNWFDYTSVQSDKPMSITRMKEVMTDSVNADTSLSDSEKKAKLNDIKNTTGDDVREMYLEQFGGVKLKEGISLKFLPGDQYAKGVKVQEYSEEERAQLIKEGKILPGFHNDVNEYMRLCKQYGVTPRFTGIEAKLPATYDEYVSLCKACGSTVKYTAENYEAGKTVDITEHPSYQKVLKETARTDTPQEEIVADFDTKYLMERVQEAASTNAYGKSAPAGYIVDDFINNVLGEDLEVGYMTFGSVETKFASAKDSLNPDVNIDGAIEEIQKLKAEGKKGFTREEYKEFLKKYGNPVSNFANASTRLTQLAAEGNASMNSPKYHAENDFLLDALNEALRNSKTNGDAATYAKMKGRMYGLLNSERYKPAGNTGNLINTARLLANDVGVHISEGMKMRKGDVSMDKTSNGIFTTTIQNSTFTTVMEDIGDTVRSQLFDAGVIDSFTDARTADFDENFARYMTLNDAAVTADSTVSEWKAQFDDACRRAIENGNESVKTMYEAIQNRRDAMLKYVRMDSARKVNAQIVSKDARRTPESKAFRERLDEFLYKTVDASAIAGLVDDRVGNHKLQNAVLLLKNHAAQSRADRILTGSRILDLNGNVVDVESLATLRDRVGLKPEHEALLADYLVAKVAMDRFNQGKPAFQSIDEIEDATGYAVNAVPTMEDIQNVIDRVEGDRNYKPIADFAEGFWKLNQTILKRFLVDEGLLDEETYNTWLKETPHYASLQRYMGEGGKGTSIASNANGVQFKKYKGASSREVISPIESFVGQVNAITNAAAMNRVKLALKEQYDANRKGLESLVREVDYDILNKDSNGIPVDDDIITVYEKDGTKTYMQVTNPELYNLVANMGYEQAGEFAQKLSKVTSFMTKLTTGVNFLFAGKNAMRDFKHSVNYGSYAATYLTGLPKWVGAFIDTYKEMMRGNGSQQMKDYIAMGGGGWTRYSTTERDAAKQTRRAIYGETAAQKAGHFITRVLTLEDLQGIIETTSRFAEYKYGKNETGDGATEESKEKAYMAAQEATVDFKRKGNSKGMALLRALTPFLNASLQGTYQDLRLLTNMDDNDRRGTIIRKTVINNMLSGALSAALMLFGIKGGDDDPEGEQEKQAYLDMDQGMKWNYFLIPARYLLDKRDGEGHNGIAIDIFGGRNVVRTPVSAGSVESFCFGLGQTALENYYKARKNAQATGEYALEEMANGLAGDVADLALNVIQSTFFEYTTIASPLLQVGFNRTWYGSDMVSESLKSKSDNPSSWYNSGTSGAAVYLSRSIQDVLTRLGKSEDAKIREFFSPIAIDYLTQQFTGIIGQTALPMLSPNKYSGEYEPINQLKQSVINAYTLDTDNSSRMEDAYEQAYSMIETGVGEMKNGIFSRFFDSSLPDSEIKDGVYEGDKLISKGGRLYDIQAEIKAKRSQYYACLRSGVYEYKDPVTGDKKQIDYSNLPEKQAAYEAEKILADIRTLETAGYAIAKDYLDKYCGFGDIKSGLDAVTRTPDLYTDMEERSMELDDNFRADFDNNELYMQTAFKFAEANPTQTTLTPNPKYEFSDGNGNDISVPDDMRREFAQQYAEAYRELANDLMGDLDYLDEKTQLKKWSGLHNKAMDYAKSWFYDSDYYFDLVMSKK